MTGHLREQILVYNHVSHLGMLSVEQLQHTMDDFNKHTRRGGTMRGDTRREKVMDREQVGWTSIDTATENLMKQEWMDDKARFERERQGIPIGSLKVVDVNKHGKPIMRNGRRMLMTFEYRRLKGRSNPQWVTKTWKYVD